MSSNGIQSTNRRIKAARVLAFPLLPHDCKKMGPVDCKLRNNFHFSEVHGSMNAMGHFTCKVSDTRMVVM